VQRNWLPTSVFRSPLAAIITTGVVVLFVGLGQTRLWDQDEGFFATTAAEMYARNDWIVPTFNGKLFGHKPPLMYWGMMSGYGLFGVNELGARFFSAVFGLATAIATWRLGRRLFNETTGLLAGIIMASAIFFTVVARAATPDAHLTFFAVLAFCLWCRDIFPLPHESPSTGIRWRTWLAAYIAMGFGVLTKGPIGIFFPMAVIGLFLLCTTKRREIAATATHWERIWAAIEPFGPVNFLRTTWQMRPLTAIAMLLVVAGPWYLLVGLQTKGQFLVEFFGVHHFGRFTTSMDNHGGNWLYYLITCEIGMFPWSIFVIPTTMLWWQRLTRDASPKFVFIACWAAVYLVIFSLARTKLPNYVLPAYPALALMLAHCLETWLTDRQALSRFWMRHAQSLAISVGLTFVIGMPIAGSWPIGGQTILDRFQLSAEVQRETVWLGLSGLPLIAGGIGMLVLSELRRERAAITVMAVASVGMLAVVWNDTIPRIDRFQSPQSIAAELRSILDENPARVQSHCFTRPTMIFYLGQPIGDCWDACDALNALSSRKPSYLITTDERYEVLQQILPPDVEIVARRPNFPEQGEILVLARAATVTARKQRDLRR